MAKFNVLSLLFRPAEQRATLPNRAVKRVIAFDARSFYDVVDCLEMNLFGMPLTQCTKYVDKKRLNYMRSLGIKYSTFDLYENDIYVIPRHVIQIRIKNNRVQPIYPRVISFFSFFQICF